MFITSPIFNSGSLVPEPHTCSGDNISPPLEFGQVPESARSLVLTVQDIDASPAPWVHWLVFNIPVTTTSVAAGTIPAGGTEGYANGGTPGYEGPCPKYFSGTHHYHFELHALDIRLDLPATADKAQLEPHMQGHIIDSARLIGLCRGSIQ